MKGNTYVFVFAMIVCVVCSVLLSFLSEGLRPRQELNMDLDVKKNILKSVVLKDPLPIKAKPEDILSVYKNKIKELVIDANGQVIEGRTPADIKPKEKAYPFYVYSEGDTVVSYAFPIVGQGLWSTLYGYLALESDAIRVRGITFYKHGETPGLGAEIEKEWFQNNFKGKKVWSAAKNALRPIKVVKGKATDHYKGEDLDYYVDGITAATITGSGVTEMLDRNLQYYDPYFSKVRKK